MAQYKFIEHVGQEGLEVTRQDLNHMATFHNQEYGDMIVPVFDITLKEQAKRIKTCNHKGKSHEYWHCTEGDHGWFCAHCGVVIQWG